MNKKKQNRITGAASSVTVNNLTPSRVVIPDVSDKLTNPNITVEEVNYLAGVNSLIQTQLNRLSTGKQNVINGAASTIRSGDLETNGALISDTNGKVAVSNLTNTELSYLSGLASNRMTKLSNLNNLSAKSGNGIDSIYSSTLLNKLIAVNKISIARVINPDQPDDGQIKFDVNI